mmetsp:Transcript_10675/g.27959  ORF Transcript_10675/g.27959 Transcript_10675/m.27959 type:complete len:106 (-) Transcript_10675:109-426(-)
MQEQVQEEAGKTYVKQLWVDFHAFTALTMDVSRTACARQRHLILISAYLHICTGIAGKKRRISTRSARAIQLGVSLLHFPPARVCEAEKREEVRRRGEMHSAEAW